MDTVLPERCNFQSGNDLDARKVDGMTDEFDT